LYRSAQAIGPVFAHGAEDSRGVRAIDDALQAQAKQENLSMLSLDYITPDKQKGGNSKNITIGLLATAMDEHRVFLSSDLPSMPEIRDQFERWTIDAERRKDDAPDCAAQLWKHFKDKIHSVAVSAMEEAPIEDSWEYEVPEYVDPHADEYANADIELLESQGARTYAGTY
jgi:hypothetical protein